MTTVRSRIGIRELRDNLTATIRRVRAGEALEVTHDGVPVAILVAPLPEDRVRRLLARGDVTPPRTLDRPLQRHPAATGSTASETIEDDRR